MSTRFTGQPPQGGGEGSAGQVAAIVALANVALVGIPAAWVTTHNTPVVVIAAISAIGLPAIFLVWQNATHREGAKRS